MIYFFDNPNQHNFIQRKFKKIAENLGIKSKIAYRLMKLEKAKILFIFSQVVYIGWDIC